MINLFNNDRLFDEIVGNEFDFFLKFNLLIPKFLSIFIDFKLRRGRAMVNMIFHLCVYLKSYLLTR